MPKETRERLLHDQAHLVGALRDYRKGKTPPLSEPELAALIGGIERRLEEIEKKLAALSST